MKTIKIALIMVFFLLAMIGGFTYSIWNWYAENSKPVMSERPIEISIDPGFNTSRIGNLLKNQNVIRSSLLFKIYIRFLAIDQQLKPGQYSFTGKETLPEVIQQLLKGNMKTVSVTIPEGTTLKEAAAILQDAGICKVPDFIEAVSDSARLGMIFTDWELIPAPEGLIFPDTYFFAKGSSATAVAERMLKLMKHQIDKVFCANLPNGLSQYEGCILASIVEKEAVIDKDRPLIASVFYNRLRKNMKLETDASVQYAFGERKTRVLYEDLKIDSPYNTYLYPGLPPTPISNFGIASMKAVACPADTDYLFFVANGINGGHNFSKTIGEHQKNTKEYFENRKRKK